MGKRVDLCVDVTGFFSLNQCGRLSLCRRAALGQFAHIEMGKHMNDCVFV